MLSYGMFSHVRRPAGTLVHKAVGEAGARYATREGGVGAGVGYDGALHTRCGRELPPLGTPERNTLQPPEDSALRWTEVTCEACLAKRYRAPAPQPVAGGFCACGHDKEQHLATLGGACTRCLALGWSGLCEQRAEV